MKSNLIKSASTCIRTATTLGLMLTLGLAALHLPAQSAPPTKRQTHLLPNEPDIPEAVREDILLIMPNSKAKKDELAKAFKDIKGTVIGTMGKGDLQVLLVQTEHGKADAAERKLSADKKHFSKVDRNQRIYADYVPSTKEPDQGSAWHLQRMNCEKAWDHAQGYRVGIAVLDSGVEYSSDCDTNKGIDVTGVYKKIAEKLKSKMGGFLGTGLFGDDVDDLEDKILHWANEANTMTYVLNDNNGHGTNVASAAAGRFNGKASVGVAPQSNIFAVRIADGPYGARIYTDDIKVTAGLMCIYDWAQQQRIVNISYGGMMDDEKHEVLHELMKFLHDKRNVLFFVSAGNNREYRDFENKPYLNVVSAMAPGAKMQLVNTATWGSAYGPCVDFTAPGQNIRVADPNGTGVSVDGTSFSSPIVAGVAALIWSANPGLKNTDVEAILRASCINPAGGWTEKFGWGMPDAERAVKLAKGIR